MKRHSEEPLTLFQFGFVVDGFKQSNRFYNHPLNGECHLIFIVLPLEYPALHTNKLCNVYQKWAVFAQNNCIDTDPETGGIPPNSSGQICVTHVLLTSNTIVALRRSDHFSQLGCSQKKSLK